MKTMAELSRLFPVWLCDVWGVLHNGRRVYDDAAAVLHQHREAGGCVILITNAPRPSRVIVPQLRAFDVPDTAWDAIVSSGDVTRDLVARRNGARVHHLGPAEDAALLEDLPVEFTSLDEAECVLVTGLLRDGRNGEPAETPQDYVPVLEKMKSRQLDMICANPDKVVGIGGVLYPCAGAIADIYEDMGGHVEMAGKPFAPIYDLSLRLAGEHTSHPVSKDTALAIGDGLPTDIEGARRNGISALFISHGIHAADFDGLDPDQEREAMQQRLPGLRLMGVAPALVWTQ